MADKKSKGGPSGAKALEGKRVKKKKRILHSVQNDKGVKPPIRQAQGKRKLPRGIRQAHPKGCYLDEAAAQRVVDFIQCLKHTKGKWAGQPFKLLPWQLKIVREVFGTLKAKAVV